MKKTENPVVVEQTFNASIEKVWDAITDINQMHQWYFDNIPAFEARVGFETQFNVQSEERNFLHKWKVTEATPKEKIAYMWTFAGYPGEGLVVFELFSQKNSTLLRVTNHGLESFPQDVAEFERESCIAGWTYFIQKRLKEYLEKTSTGN